MWISMGNSIVENVEMEIFHGYAEFPKRMFLKDRDHKLHNMIIYSIVEYAIFCWLHTLSNCWAHHVPYIILFRNGESP
jgi:hypothetical protein